MEPLFYSPDCAGGKHAACSGDAWDFDQDVPTGCGCSCHQEVAA